MLWQRSKWLGYTIERYAVYGERHVGFLIVAPDALAELQPALTQAVIAKQNVRMALRFGMAINMTIQARAVLTSEFPIQKAQGEHDRQADVDKEGD